MTRQLGSLWWLELAPGDLQRAGPPSRAVLPAGASRSGFLDGLFFSRVSAQPGDLKGSGPPPRAHGPAEAHRSGFPCGLASQTDSNEANLYSSNLRIYSYVDAAVFSR